MAMLPYPAASVAISLAAPGSRPLLSPRAMLRPPVALTPVPNAKEPAPEAMEALPPATALLAITIVLSIFLTPAF